MIHQSVDPPTQLVLVLANQTTNLMLTIKMYCLGINRQQADRSKHSTTEFLLVVVPLLLSVLIGRLVVSKDDFYPPYLWYCLCSLFVFLCLVNNNDKKASLAVLVIFSFQLDSRQW